MSVKLSEQEKRQQRFVLMLPILIIPFAAIFFWMLGGGAGKMSDVTEQPIAGINLSLPDVTQKKHLDSKLDYYQHAERDSAQYKELQKNDPYSKSFGNISAQDELIPYEPFGENYTFQNDYTDPNERKVYERLNALNKTLKEAESFKENELDEIVPSGVDPEVIGLREDMKRLEAMMNIPYDNNSLGHDPEIMGINEMLERVLDIQHPDRVRERIKANSEEHRGAVYALSPTKKEVPITELLSNQVIKDSSIFKASKSSRFYGLQDYTIEYPQRPAIQAAVHETQLLVSGATIKLRLLQDVYVSGVLVTKGQFIYGKVNLSGERLLIDVTSFQYDNQLFPIDLTAFDLDGLPGIRIPGSITRDAIKQNSDQALSSMSNVGMFNPSLGAQAATAGLDIGRNLLSKKIKLVKVEVKAGYRVLLSDNNSKY